MVVHVELALMVLGATVLFAVPSIVASLVRLVAWLIWKVGTLCARLSRPGVTSSTKPEDTPIERVLMPVIGFFSNITLRLCLSCVGSLALYCYVATTYPGTMWYIIALRDWLKNVL